MIHSVNNTFIYKFGSKSSFIFWNLAPPSAFRMHCRRRVKAHQILTIFSFFLKFLLVWLCHYLNFLKFGHRYRFDVMFHNSFSWPVTKLNPATYLAFHEIDYGPTAFLLRGSRCRARRWCSSRRRYIVALPSTASTMSMAWFPQDEFLCAQFWVPEAMPDQL